MYERSMSPEERAEYQTLLAEVLGDSHEVDADMVGRYRELLIDASNAQRAWADFVLDAAQLDGLRNDLKRKVKRESIALVDYHGKPVGVATRVGVPKRASSGKSRYVQTLFSAVSWDELAEWLDMINGQIQTLLINRHVAQRLIGLREQFPDTLGPGEACGRLGTTVEQFLAAESA